MKKLPNGFAARVGFEKLTGYLLSDTHPVGKGKAAFFKSLGFSSEQPQELLAELLRLARSEDVVDHALTRYGTKYVVDGKITGTEGTAIVRTVWFIERDTAAPKLVTAYPAPSEGA